MTLEINDDESRYLLHLPRLTPQRRRLRVERRPLRVQSRALRRRACHLTRARPTARVRLGPGLTSLTSLTSVAPCARARSHTSLRSIRASSCRQRRSSST
jgi:hypothetical protein